MSLTVIAPVFKRGNKWRCSDGTHDDIWVTIKDENLWRQVGAHQELFGAGDVLVARVEIRQTMNAAGAPIETERTILEVLRHEPGAPQPELFESD